MHDDFKAKKYNVMWVWDFLVHFKLLFFKNPNKLPINKKAHLPPKISLRPHSNMQIMKKH